MNNEVPGSATFAIAVLGAALGLLNTWNSLVRQKVNLKVRPAYGINESDWVLVEVVNLSTFAVTISAVGFELSGKQRIFNSRRLADNSNLPCRLESREALTALFLPSELQPESLHQAFAMTSCGEIAFGDSPALEQIRSGKSPMFKKHSH